jgi:hypothetical protein
MNRIVGVAIYPYVPQEDDELPLKKGDSVNILEKSSNGWWRGEVSWSSVFENQGFVSQSISREKILI